MHPIQLSIVIPYFQREQGILRRAVTSILAQELPSNVSVDIWVIDDASPCPASPELTFATIPAAFRIHHITQANGGPSSARNAALDRIDPGARYIAFLDSDDWWHKQHLQKAVQRLETGNDIYFCDNKREGMHASHFALGPRMAEIIERAGTAGASLTSSQAFSLVLREFPAQLSTLVYRRSIAPELRFDTSFRLASEDMLFCLELVQQAHSIVFSPSVDVECGQGVNIYFSNLDWDSPRHLQQLADRLAGHLMIDHKLALSSDDKSWNRKLIAKLRRNFAFHVIRHVRTHRKWPAEVQSLAKYDKSLKVWLPFYAMQVGLGKTIGAYNPG